jgi:hypothetical protein
MNRTQAAAILGVAAGYDRFINVDELTTAAWFLVLEPYEFEDVQKAVVTYYRDMWNGKDQLSPRVLLDDVRGKIRSDVRVAKRAGLISEEWPESDRLPDDVLDDLATYRKASARFQDDGWMSQRPFEQWFRECGYTYKTKTLKDLAEITA